MLSVSSVVQKSKRDLRNRPFGFLHPAVTVQIEIDFDQAQFAGAAGQFGGVDQVAVVAQRDAVARRGVPEDRQRVLPGGGAGGRVPTVADGDVPDAQRLASTKGRGL